MMKKKLLILSCLSLVVFSCKKEDPKPYNPLAGNKYECIDDRTGAVNHHFFTFFETDGMQSDGFIDYGPTYEKTFYKDDRGSYKYDSELSIVTITIPNIPDKIFLKVSGDSLYHANEIREDSIRRETYWLKVK